MLLLNWSKWKCEAVDEKCNFYFVFGASCRVASFSAIRRSTMMGSATHYAYSPCIQCVLQEEERRCEEERGKKREMANEKIEIFWNFNRVSFGVCIIFFFIL